MVNLKKEIVVYTYKKTLCAVRKHSSVFLRRTALLTLMDPKGRYKMIMQLFWIE